MCLITLNKARGNFARRTSRYKSLYIGAAAFGLSVAIPVSAGDSWFSRVTTTSGASEPATLIDQRNVDVTDAQSEQSNLAVFDIAVSIEADPQGDDDYSADSGSSDDAQNNYETMLEYFSDSVCEQTNGAHKIGKIRVFRNFDQQSRADVKWASGSGRPGAHTTGFGKKGWQVFMYDTFGAIQINGSDLDREKLGYILGHEWGHYTLGVYDEYVEANRPTGTRPSQPLSSDVAVDKSIMHRGRTAAGSSSMFEWLNHSTSTNIGDVGMTAQGRVYGKSGWETLVQPTANDPKKIVNWVAPTRTQYTTLASKIPGAADNGFKIELPAGQADCRNQLDILWVADVEMQIVFDTSGSMSGSPIANARVAANTLVDITEGGNSAIGVVSFASSASQRSAITEIPDPGTAERAAIKSVISGLNASGGTAMYDGLDLGLTNLQSYASTNSTSASQVVFLLSDGGDNSSSTNQSSVTSRYQGAAVPIIAFGYGSGAPGGVLRSLATDTGGEFFSSCYRHFLQ